MRKRLRIGDIKARDLSTRISDIRNSLSSEVSDGNDGVGKKDGCHTGNVLVDKGTLGKWCSLLDDVLGMLDNQNSEKIGTSGVKGKKEEEHLNNVLNAARGYVITKSKTKKRTKKKRSVLRR